MLELEHGYPAVDAHTRLAPDAGSQDRGYMVAPDRLERELRQAGIVRSLVATPPGPEDYVGPNNWVARVAVDRPFVPAARIAGSEPMVAGRLERVRAAVSGDEREGTSPADAERYGYGDRFQAFVLDPVVDGLPNRDLLDTLEDVGLPVVVDAWDGGLPDRLLEWSFPLVLAGFGGGGRDQIASVVDACGSHDQLYLDTRFVRHRDVLERALLEHPDRVVFGSGAPACHPDVAVMEILTLDVSEDLLRRALWKNAARVIPALDPGATDF